MSTEIRLSSTYVYPVKSLRGVRVDSLTIEHGCVVGDRLWMLIDEYGHFMHQRDYPQMATVQVQNDGASTVLTSQIGQTLTLHATPAAGSLQIEYVRIWRRAAPVVAVSTEADEWFTEALGVKCRIVRHASGHLGLDVPTNEVDATLQDATPFHLTSDDSLADLIGRMGRSIPMIRFRPNITVAGATPYAEDGWKRFRIGEHAFQWAKPCTRCVLTTTDHLSGARESKEPLRTLATYRRWGNEVVFGHYFTTTSRSGQLRVGDPVMVDH